MDRPSRSTAPVPCTAVRGCLTQSSQPSDRRTMDHGLGPEPSTSHLAPRAFRVGVVDSLGEGFVC